MEEKGGPLSRHLVVDFSALIAGRIFPLCPKKGTVVVSSNNTWAVSYCSRKSLSVESAESVKSHFELGLQFQKKILLRIRSGNRAEMWNISWKPVYTGFCEYRGDRECADLCPDFPLEK